MRLSLLLIASILFTTLTTPLSASTTSIEKLFTLINERLACMKDVAAFKWENKKPVEDLPREAIVLEKSVAKAESEGLNANAIRPFFISQITVAKNLQNAWQEEWREQGFPNTLFFKDLQDTRQVLIELGNEILAAIMPSLPTLQDASQRDTLYTLFKQSISVEKVTERDKSLIFEKLVEIQAKTTQDEL